MTAGTAADVLIVDPLDRGLEQLLRGCGMQATRANAAELAALVHPTAKLPDVILIDTRGARAIPPSLAAVKRQHPELAVLVVASESDPTMLLEAMRAGANEFVQEPLSAAALEEAIGRLVAHRANAGVTERREALGAPGADGQLYAVAREVHRHRPAHAAKADAADPRHGAALRFIAIYATLGWPPAINTLLLSAE